MNKKLKVLMSGGGTGGHIFPAIAIADEIRRRFPDAEFLFIGANGKMEMEKVPQSGYPIEGLSISGFDRGRLLANLKLPFKLIGSLRRAQKLIKAFKPDFAVGTGGFASGPALYAAAQLGVPTFIQEQNAHAGMTNKILGRKAKAVFTAYPDVAGFEKTKIKFLGNPIRQAMIEGRQETASAKAQLGLNRDKLTILSVGGSLGSRTLNNSWKENIDRLIAKDYQLIWQTGKNDYEEITTQWAKQRAEPLPETIQIKEFIADMPLYYSAADLIVSRAGAIAISELAVAQKPVILVPFPFAAEDHQSVNAQRLVERNAAKMVKDHEMKDRFWEVLSELGLRPELREEMSQNIAFFAKPEAAKHIVDELLKTIGIPSDNIKTNLK
ncbi:undecaprenyldiphospho-muramoylpentapeptide beta-N-acetylglucosaminyltransferase [Bergeyella sp. RCAD1439]|uniref:undecaprenyldiphospho-muramoylpentapeptide beta-N-acetylglucosaminyltransferase n=1 Tax=Bergeyella anatis TaxID=3113737 RepID=UPI002E185EE0|nr:undecaprenyldiphospho-muramoylpentapeptide beta-N-acetylglucosaminyltransferase [Bergeyella sp. RCAD1439]